MNLLLLLLLTLLSSSFFHGCWIGTSQAAPVTDPTEANALNSIFAKWNISAEMSRKKWNTSSDICAGVGLEGTGPVSPTYASKDFNPGIICDCRYQNGSVCHITRLKVHNLNITGRLPTELMNLTYLNNLHLRANHFTGPLPTFIGNFSSLEYISIGLNFFSGELPKELGKLKKLKSLGFGLNNFTGRLPEELGNMKDLEQMYITGMGLVGGLPSSFGNFKKLMILQMGDNNFGEKLPDFIGNLSKLETLKILGNSFKGPIPSSFRNLVNLRTLWLSDVLDESSSLSFIENMPLLNAVILRNDQISGAIPPSIGKLVNLAYLDLSFNNLSGQIPPPLFSLPKLEKLYLGNNNFTGALPKQKGNRLNTIDLSYNSFSGSLPSWTTEDNLQLNLVANEFDSNSELPRGLECIQKSTPCYRGSPVYSSFAINCGGDKVSSHDGTTYEADIEKLSAASYFVNKNRRWAVSSVGNAYAGTTRYILLNSLKFPEVSNQELFQSARASTSSLRYYGLALENGNYTVELKFSETAFLDTQSWLNLGKRIFDIYIQGILVEKDFDIVKEASKSSSTATSRNYTAFVSKNFLDVHLFWAGKGTCCIPVDGYYGPSISAISVIPNFVPTVSNQLPKKHKNLVPGIVGGTGAALLLFLILGILMWRWKRRQISEEDRVSEGLSGDPNCFSFAELKIASDNFSSASKLGQGGFGPVYKGILSDGTPVAIKQLSSSSPQGRAQFATEVSAISAVQHRNLVKLHGCCYEGTNRLLVYEYMENKSLDQALFGQSGLHLEWPARFDICLGTARGLAYLHEESSIRIVHRDIKASNILLDANLNPKISDFGLAKLYDDKMTLIITRVAGTMGYLAPEYAMRGLLTEKVDVYGFGIVLLEILTGRPNAGWNSGGRKVDFLDWSWNFYEKHQGLEMLDPSLSSFNEAEAIRVIKVAFLCTQTNPTLRPAMSRVVAMLLGNAEIGMVSSKPAYLTEWDGEDTSSSSSTRHFINTQTPSTSI